LRRVRPTGPRLALAVALAAATAALVLTLAGPLALFGPLVLAVVGALLVPFADWSPVPAVLSRLLPRASLLVLLLAGFLAFLSRSLGTLALEPPWIPRVVGPVLLLTAVVFALAPRAFPVGRALAPAIIGLLAVAGVDPSPAGYGASSLPFLRGSEHNAFAERYLALAVVAMLAMWASAILESGPRWSRRAAATLGLSVALAVALAATGVIGLPLLQPRLERAVASAFSEGTTGLAGGSTLGEFAELAVSRRRVLDLQTFPQSDGGWRLPSEVFVSFDGRRWANPPAAASGGAAGALQRAGVVRPATAPSPASPLLEGIGAWFEVAPPASEAVELRITQAEVDDWPLFVPRGAVAVTADAWYLEVDRHGLLRRPPGNPLRLYGALWSGGPRPAGGSLAGGELAESLSLPPRVDPRLTALAQELAAQSPEPARMVEATVRHLQTGYRYTLAPGAFRTGDPLAEFLFEKKAGYCEYFASAAVVLLRLQGVPARFVKGLSVGPHSDQGGGLHVVRESDAHAWVEAWIPGEGWGEADPTPPGQFVESRPRPSALARLAERMRAAVSSAWTRLMVRGPVASLRWLAGRVAVVVRQAVREPLAWFALVTVLLGRRLLRVARARLRRAPPPSRDASDHAVPADLRALVRDLERRWAAAGRSRPEGRGLLEHAHRVATGTGRLPPLPPAVAAAGPRIVEAYYGARFGGQTPSDQELRPLRDALRG